MNRKAKCPPEVVVGATIRDLLVDIVDEDDAPVDLTGITAVKLQGHAATDLAPEIDEDGTVESPATAGVVKFEDAGTFVTLDTLNTLRVNRITYTLQVKLMQGADDDWTEEVQVTWTRPPLEYT